MTTYLLGDEIYERTFRRLIVEDVDVSDAVVAIRACRAAARRARAEASAPGFRSTIPGYLPGYGVEAEVRAIADYCRVKKIMLRSAYFRDLAVKKFDSDRWQAERSSFGMNLDDGGQ
jgi:hypothetical protein